MTPTRTQKPVMIALESSRVRRDLLVVMIMLALVSPNITMPGGLPAIRLEQLMMAALLPSLALFHWRNREYARLGLPDIIFAALAAAMTLSIIVAPLLVDSVDWSIRDPFEIARVVEYWLMYRFGLTLVPGEGTSRTILYAILAGSIGMTVFSVIQYLDGRGQFNADITRHWANGHNLVGVQREGRVIGTIGNANYYGFFMALPIIAGLALVLLKWRAPSRNAWMYVMLGTFASVLSAVLAQSRTGAVAIFFGMFCGLVLVLAWRRPSAPLKAIGVFLVFLTISVTFVQVQPPLVGSFNARFNPAKVDDDASFIIRVQRLRSFFTGFFADTASFCEGDRLDKAIISKSHDTKTSQLPPASTDAALLARDDQRKEDVRDITQAVVDYFCDEDVWPSSKPLAELLVPKYLPALPRDPANGDPYLAYVMPSGFTIGTRLENEGDPDTPFYTLGTIPNFVVNPSFESAPGATWGARNGATIESVDGGLFGDKAGDVQIGPGGDVRQFIAFDFSLDTDYTMNIWAKSPTGADQQLRLYVVGQQIDGSEYDPLVKHTFTLPGDGRWVQLSMPFHTPAKGRITTFQFMLRAATNDESVHVLVDGATVEEGTFAQSFRQVTDVDPSRLRPQNLPQFSDSPIVGVGPRNNAEAGAFDNEYILFLDRYGLLGIIPYFGMYVVATMISLRAFQRRSAMMDVLGLTGFAFTMTLFLFNLGAGSYYHFAIMAIYWMYIGYLATATRLPLPLSSRSDNGGSAPGKRA